MCLDLAYRGLDRLTGVIDGVTADKLPALLAELDAAGAPGSPGS